MPCSASATFACKIERAREADTSDCPVADDDDAAARAGAAAAAVTDDDDGDDATPIAETSTFTSWSCNSSIRGVLLPASCNNAAAAAADNGSDAGVEAAFGVLDTEAEGSTLSARFRAIFTADLEQTSSVTRLKHCTAMHRAPRPPRLQHLVVFVAVAHTFIGGLA